MMMNPALGNPDYWSQFDRHLEDPNAGGGGVVQPVPAPYADWNNQGDTTSGGVPTNNTGVNGGANLGSLGLPPGVIPTAYTGGANFSELPTRQPMPWDNAPPMTQYNPYGPGGSSDNRTGPPGTYTTGGPATGGPFGNGMFHPTEQPAPSPYGSLGNLGYGRQLMGGAQQPRMVHMRNPQTGQVHLIPFDQVQAAQQAGGVRI